MKIGRNTPCPCGSGKKYKQCCGASGAQAVLSLERTSSSRMTGEVRKKLQEYLVTRESPQEIQLGLTRFFPELLTGDFQLTETQFHHAFDWLFFGYRTSDGSTFCARYAERGKDLDEGERELLRAWADAVPGFFSVDAVKAGEAHLRRLPDGQVFEVPSMGKNVKPGMLITLWLLPTGLTYLYSHAVGSIDPKLTGPLTHLLQIEMEFYRYQQPNATWESFYRDLWPRLMEVVPIAERCMANVYQLKLPPMRAVQWNGQPLPGSTKAWDEVARLIRLWVPETGDSWEDPSAALRLWWDVIVALRPRVTQAPAWAVAILYLYRHVVLGDPRATQAELAYGRGARGSIVGTRCKKAVAALDIRKADLRYVNLLDGEVRMAWQRSCLYACGLLAAGGPER